MKDYLGNEIEIGDNVVAIMPDYRMFVKGVVYQFTPQKVRIEYYYNFSGNKQSSRTILQEPDQIICINKVRN